MDICVPIQLHDAPAPQRTGYLASTLDEYVAALEAIVSLSEAERRAIQRAARQHVASTFSEQGFEDAFLRATRHVLDQLSVKKSN